MADDDDFKIKGAAVAASTEHADGAEEKKTEVSQKHQDNDADSTTDTKAPTSELGEAEAKSDDIGTTQKPTSDKQSQEELMQRYRWCKCICDPLQYGHDHYYLQMDTQESQWEEPSEPYWLWDATKQVIDESGLHYPGAPGTERSQNISSEPDPNYTGYNPKIHGNYDPNAPYAQYHNKKREEETGGQQAAVGIQPESIADYAAAGTFNRFTGKFQGDDTSADRHSDFNKSGRQLNAYFDVDAAANAHDGRSLKEERRNEKLTKKQIRELAEKRRAKKEKKRMDFYKS